MPFNLLKKYNDLLDITGMNPAQRSQSLRGVFDRDILKNTRFYFNGKPIYPTPKENGEIAMETLFTHLTCREEDKETHHREFELSRSQRLHWIRFHVEGGKRMICMCSLWQSLKEIAHIFMTMLSIMLLFWSL